MFHCVVEFKFDGNIPYCYEKTSKSGSLKVKFLKSRIFIWEIYKTGFFLPRSEMRGSQAKSGNPAEIGVVGHSAAILMKQMNNHLYA